VPLDLTPIAGFMAFALITFAALNIGDYFARWRLPLITGFLVTGVLAGPSVLGMIPAEAIPKLRLVDQMALAFIGFAAGGELHLRELQRHLRTVALTTGGLVVSTFILGTIAAAWFFQKIPVIAELGDLQRWAVAGLAGSILVARSPSSAIAIVRELRARGPFTRTALGVTVIMDAVVIIVFAGAMAVAEAVLSGSSINLPVLGLLVINLLLSTALGWGVGKFLGLALGTRLADGVKVLLLLSLGAGLFRFAGILGNITAEFFGHELHFEPLFVCMVAGVTVTNATGRRLELEQLLHKAGPAVYVVFFTLTGASLDLRVLMNGAMVAVALAAVRLLSIALGSWLGGTLAGAPARQNRLAWAGFITQAGVGLGLAKEVSGEFPVWGGTFASLMIGVIVINQFLGPPLFKWVLRRLGEAHPQADRPDFEGTRDALIFGLENQSLALARQLASHGWSVRIATRRGPAELMSQSIPGVDIVKIESLEKPCLKKLEAKKFEAVVALLNDEENLQICELLYEEVGTRNVVVHLHDRAMAEQFLELGAIPVEPGMAFSRLLDHMVRSPAATSMILGMDQEKDVEEIEVFAFELQGVPLRNLDLPVDALVLSVVRDHRQIVSHGYTRLQIGDHLTVMGGQETLEDVRRLLEG
jgi:Trk K+ transport system NAD-binding subunit/Kef-type K+ transport system membrane component KefB